MANAGSSAVFKQSSKENILPGRQQRKLSTRNSKQVFASHSDDELAQKKKFYEEEINAYSGDDPLNLWFNYIKWIEQNYPKGGREGNLGKVIQQCLLILKNEENYFNDDRFIDIWIKYATLSKKSIDIFSNMSGRGIGSQSAKFYVCWAQEAEKMGNMKQASEILQEGISNNAKPSDTIKAYCSELKLQNSKSGLEYQANQFDAQVLENKKTSLKINKENVINQNDIVDSVKQFGTASKQKNSRSTKTCASQKVIDSQKVTSLKTTETISNSCPAESANNSNQCITIFSKSKLWPPPIALFEPVDPLVQPKYMKTVIYNGTDETSFEEIMASKWNEVQRKLEDERRRLQEEKEKEELKNQLKQLQEKVLQLETMVAHQNKEVNNPNDLKDPVDQLSASKNKKSSKFSDTSSRPSFTLPSLTVCTENSTHSLSVKKGDPTFIRELSNNCCLPEQSEEGVVINQKLGNTYMTNEVNCMLQGLYNGTLGNHDDNNESFCLNFDKNYDDEFDGINKNNEDAVPSDFQLITKNLNSNEEGKLKLFSIYKDPTEVLTLASAIPSFPTTDGNEEKVIGSNHVGAHMVSSTKKSSNEKISKSVLKENLENVPPDFIESEVDEVAYSNNILICKNIQNLPLNDQSKTEELFKNEHGKSDGTYKDIWKDTTNLDLGKFARQLDDNFTILTSEQFTAACAAPFTSTPYVKSNVFENRNIRARANEPIHEDDAKILEQLDNASIAEILQNALIHADTEIQEILTPILSAVNRNNNTKAVQEICLNAIEQFKLCKELTKNDKLNNILEHCITRIQNYTCYDQYRMNQITEAQENLLQLSTIMEASHESKSSSTNSCTNSMKQKLSHNACHSNSSRMIKTANSENHEKLTVIQESEYSLNERSKIQGDEKQNSVAGQSKPFDYNMDIDPFDPEVTSRLLKTLPTPISEYERFYDCKHTSFNVKIGASVQLGNIECEIEHLHGEGAYAKVYFAQSVSSFIDYTTFGPSPKYAVKVCKNANEWEFYTCSELNNRIVKKNIMPNIQDSILQMKTVVSFENCLVIVGDLFERGTLLDVVNVFKKQKARVPESLVMFFALEMLHIVSGIHQCGIIHADVKPDNFVLNDISATMDTKLMLEKPCFLRLIDFGRSIDLNLFKPGVTFSVVVNTDGFQCVQMKEGRPWVYETDWYGVLSCIHILLFSEYMDVRKNANGQWEPVQKFKRYFQVDIWQPLFQALLNIPSPYEVPDLTPFINMLSEKLHKNLKDLKSQMFKLVVTLMSKSR